MQPTVLHRARLPPLAQTVWCFVVTSCILELSIAPLAFSVGRTAPPSVESSCHFCSVIKTRAPEISYLQEITVFNVKYNVNCGFIATYIQHLHALIFFLFKSFLKTTCE